MGPARKRRRGGIQQRSRAAADELPEDVKSDLAGFLLYNVAWGIFSPQMAQTIAGHAVADFDRAREHNSRLPLLEQLAHAGNRGTHPNLVSRNVMRSVPGISLPDPFQFQLPFKKPLGRQKSSAMLPHELFSALYNFYPDAWSTSVLPSEEVLSSFWDGNQGHPQMSNHPIKDRSGFRTKCIPIGMHGDEVPVTGIGKCWSKMLLTFSWFSMVAGAASTKNAMLWIWATFEQFSVEGEHGTLDTFMKVLEWSLYWMWLGLWPTHSWTGEVQLGTHNAHVFA